MHDVDFVDYFLPRVKSCQRHYIELLLVECLSGFFSGPEVKTENHWLGQCGTQPLSNDVCSLLLLAAKGY